MKDLVAFDDHEKAAESQRFKKRWVQSTQISDKIGKNKRLSEAITTSINNTRSLFKGKEPLGTLDRFKRQTSNSLTVDGLLNNLRTSCVNGVDDFKGGLTGADITCDPTHPGDRYRRIDGVCNNIENKFFGATGIEMRRLATPAYKDGKLG